MISIRTTSKVLNTYLVPAMLVGTPLLSVQGQEEDEEDIFELSPFTVEGQDNEGYRASTTLAGSRLRTKLTDLGASIAVVTKDFMTDTGATDGESLLAYVGNMEVGGTQGNFSNANIDNGSTNEARNNPQSAQRVRGLVSASTTRDYFQTIIPFDGYNTSRVTVNRGPNSVLFGLGSPGGVINNSLNRASLDADSSEISLRFDHRGGNRMTADFNRTLIEDRLAVRVSALNENVKYKQDPAHEDDKRIYLAWNSVLFPNERSEFLGRTVFRGNVEYGEIFRNPPDVIPPFDGFSGWWNGIGDQEALNQILRTPGVDLTNVGNGAITADQVRAAVNAGLATVPDGMTLDEYAAIEGRLIPQVGFDRFQKTGFQNNTSYNPYWLYSAINYNSSAAGTEPGWDDPELAGIQGIMGRWRIGGTGAGGGTRDTRWTRTPTAGAGFREPSLMNREVFDYHNYLFQGTTNSVTTEFRLFQAVLEQEMLDGRLGLEIAFDSQRREQNRFNAFSSGDSKRISIDADIWHAPGDTDLDGFGDTLMNENFGRPVVRWNDNLVTDELRQQDTIRATAFGILDFSDFIENERLGGILGKHTLTGLYEERTNDFETRGTRGVWWADSGKFPGLPEISIGHTNNDFRRIVKQQVYLGPTGASLSSPDQLRLDGPIYTQFPQIGEVFGQWYWDNKLKTAVKNDWRIVEALANANKSRNVLTSEAFNLQSSFFDGHLIGNWARRTDEQEAWQRIQKTGNFGVPMGHPEWDPSIPAHAANPYPERIDLDGINEVDGNFNEELLFLEDSPASVDEDSTTTWGFVGHYPEKWLGELPWGMNLSAHYYEAESFQPAGISNNVLNQPLASPFGSTREKGVTVSFLDDRLTLRYNQFVTKNANARTNLGGQVGQVVGRMGFYLDRIILAENGDHPLFPTDPEELTWTTTSTPSNRQRLTGTDADLIGVNSFDEYYDLLLQILPDYVQDIYDYRIVKTDDGLGNTIVRQESNPVLGLSSTNDFVAEGREIEIIGQVTDNLSISFNAAEQETVTSNTGPVAFPLALEIAQRIEDLGLWDVRDSPVQGESGAIGASRYAGVLRTLRIEKAKDDTASPEQRQWRFNLTGRYRFSDGRFKGLNVGGSLRYQDEVAIGYPNMIDEFGNVVPNIGNPIMGPDDLAGDAFLRYKLPIAGGDVDWIIQFNARNLYRKNGNDDIPVAANPDGTISRIRIPNSRQFFLTNTFQF
ncbi:TonB-dependent receptor plug domain-containing protein [Pelagicoccus mobilis]|uniref:TonB-dependent receptor n=1 Tax=Pelagicoccus mobilis TaxID=415221 RepID=A0A934RS21_9BACT|nr:TonB-dependent receptor plug domain-containing protein [Pelagicoccus mobilis]MBK1875353.1 TonB-dependent receptor [Pelagicoccus mobilis]